MEKLNNKLLADYVSNHVVMVYPSMHQKFLYYEDMKNIYSQTSNILSTSTSGFSPDIIYRKFAA